MPWHQNDKSPPTAKTRKKSTGPITPEGRAAVRLNGVKHGLSAETLVLAFESSADFDALLDSLQAEHQPATPTEEILVRQLAMAAWRQLRLFRAEVGFYKYQDKSQSYVSDYNALDGNGRLAYIAHRDAGNENVLLNFHRFEVRLERSIRTAVQELRRCRAERLTKSANQTQSQPKAAPNPQIVELETVERQPQPINASPEPRQDGSLAA